MKMTKLLVTLGLCFTAAFLTGCNKSDKNTEKYDKSGKLVYENIKAGELPDPFGFEYENNREIFVSRKYPGQYWYSYDGDRISSVKFKGYENGFKTTATTTFAYDASGYLVEKNRTTDYGRKDVLTYEYNEKNLVKRVTGIWELSLKEVTDYTYDENGNVVLVERQSATWNKETGVWDEDPASPDDRIEYINEYDSNGRLISRTRGDRTLYYSYDENGNLISD